MLAALALSAGAARGPGARTHHRPRRDRLSDRRHASCRAGDGEAARLFAATLGRDLDLSGLFRVLDPASFIDQGGTRIEEINFGNWTTVGARLLVTGRISTAGGDLTIEARLFDVAERRQIGGKRYQGSVRDARRMANRFADEILLLLTG